MDRLYDIGIDLKVLVFKKNGKKTTFILLI
jgi:hypothetical protein